MKYRAYLEATFNLSLEKHFYVLKDNIEMIYNLFKEYKHLSSLRKRLKHLQKDY